MNRLELNLTNTKAALEEIREPLEKFYTFHKLPHETTYALDLAIDEVLNNIISYAYPEKVVGNIYLQLETTETTLRLIIEDEGTPFNPLDTKSPDVNSPLEQRSIGGLGLHLTKEFMDEVHYQRVQQKNQFILIKNI